jgi:diguanylate cyclase (GGDEF)-like protein
LRKVAFALGAALKRPSDVVARYGGEEFGVILPATSIDGGAMIADTLCKSVSGLRVPHVFSPTVPYVTVSIGVATMQPQPGDSPDTLIRLADAALYAAKAGGRNQFRCNVHRIQLPR